MKEGLALAVTLIQKQGAKQGTQHVTLYIVSQSNRAPSRLTFMTAATADRVQPA